MIIHLLIDSYSLIAFQKSENEVSSNFQGDVTNHYSTSRQSLFPVGHLGKKDGATVNFLNENQTISGRNLKKYTR